MTATPSMPRLLVGTALRRYRELLGYALEEPARVLECHRSKISRIETGQRGIRPKELRELLTDYGVSESEQAALAIIASPLGRRRGWWEEYADIIPASYQDYLSVEAIASEILVYDAQRVPDLLRVEDYARAAADASPGTLEPGMLDRLSQMCADRQRAIIGDRCTSLSVVIGEGALRQVIGGPGVMRAQLRWLADISDACPWVTVQVLPFEGGAHYDGGCAPMAILRFTQVPSLGVVHLPGLKAGHCLTAPADVAGHVRAFSQLQVSALSPGKSARMLLEMAS
jgi:transcriptional regulator with XRE-family HTH domain